MGVGLSAYLGTGMNRFFKWVEDSPTRHGVFVALVLLGLVAALLLASGCSVGGEDPDTRRKPSATPSRPLDPAGIKACNEFAKFFAGDEPKTDRAEVSRKVHIAASNSNSGEIDDKAEVLFRNGQGDSDETWALAADSFAVECERLGWTAKDAQ